VRFVVDHGLHPEGLPRPPRSQADSHGLGSGDGLIIALPGKHVFGSNTDGLADGLVGEAAQRTHESQMAHSPVTRLGQFHATMVAPTKRTVGYLPYSPDFSPNPGGVNEPLLIQRSAIRHYENLPTSLTPEGAGRLYPKRKEVNSGPHVQNTATLPPTSGDASVAPSCYCVANSTERWSLMKIFGCLAVILFLVVAVLLCMAWGALGFGAGVSWLLGGNFVDGWHAAWSKPWILLGWSLLFIGSIGGSSSARR
jgi:hypothetical protein